MQNHNMQYIFQLIATAYLKATADNSTEPIISTAHTIATILTNNERFLL